MLRLTRLKSLAISVESSQTGPWFLLGYMLSILPLIMFHRPFDWILGEWTLIWMLATCASVWLDYLKGRAKIINYVFGISLFVACSFNSTIITKQWVQTLDQVSLPRATGEIEDYSKANLTGRTIGIYFHNGWGLRLLASGEYNLLKPTINDATREFQDIHTGLQWQFVNNEICAEKQLCFLINESTGRVSNQVGQEIGTVFEASK